MYDKAKEDEELLKNHSNPFEESKLIDLDEANTHFYSKYLIYFIGRIR